MAVTAPSTTSGIPTHHFEPYVEIDASGTALEINPGDYVCWSGQYAIAAHDGVTYWKNSGIGIALERNPAYDWAGRQLVNSALLVARMGTYRVSANFSGQPALGVLAYPDMTGSGVNAPSGATGLGAVWNTATPTTNVPTGGAYFSYVEFASAVSAYVAGTATGSALLTNSGAMPLVIPSGTINAVAQVIGWFNSGPAGTGQLDIVLWDRNADYY